MSSVMAEALSDCRGNPEMTPNDFDLRFQAETVSDANMEMNKVSRTPVYK